MTENKTMDGIHRGILKRYHTLCSLLGLGEYEKRAIVSSYGVESSRDMDTHDLINVCGHLSSELEKRRGAGDLDKLRKRVMAAIGSYLQSEGRASNSLLIKGIACRATGYEEFNKIPRQRLLNLIATFNHKVTDRERALRAVHEMVLSRMISEGV